ncbi:MAG: hypothetical protein WCI84_10965, partial [Bacteroidota bacterium]
MPENISYYGAFWRFFDVIMVIIGQLCALLTTYIWRNNEGLIATKTQRHEKNKSFLPQSYEDTKKCRAYCHKGSKTRRTERRTFCHKVPKTRKKSKAFCHED